MDRGGLSWSGSREWRCDRHESFRNAPRWATDLAGMVFGAVILAAAGAAGDELRPGIIGADDRILLEEQGPPWDAVGQVNIGGFRTSGQCTGTLIAPQSRRYGERIVVIGNRRGVIPASRHPLSRRRARLREQGTFHRPLPAFCRGVRRRNREPAPPSAGAALPALARDVGGDRARRHPRREAGAPCRSDAPLQPGLRAHPCRLSRRPTFAPVVHEGCRLLAATLPGPSGSTTATPNPGVRAARSSSRRTGPGRSPRFRSRPAPAAPTSRCRSRRGPSLVGDAGCP